MDSRAAKLALARKKLKDHQEKKSVTVPKEENHETYPQETNQNIQDVIVINENPIHSVEVPQNFDENKTDVKSNLAVAHGQQNNISEFVPNMGTDVNVTEILISNKRNLEIQIHDLQTKLSQLEYDQSLSLNNYNIARQQISYLENELKNLNSKLEISNHEIKVKEKTINELFVMKTTLSDENNNLQEQLEFTKTILTAKETENASLHSQLGNLQNQYEVMQLQLQQLTNGAPAHASQQSNSNNEQNEVLLQKISTLELQLKTLQKERDQINSHYEHYVGELNEQVHTMVRKNEEMSKEIQNLSNRENSLIDQISEMEIRLQNYNKKDTVESTKTNDAELDELKKKYTDVQNKLHKLSTEYTNLQQKYEESESKVAELSQNKEPECNHDNISLTKLNADIASDKIAAQRATEQNKKLKTDMQELEEAFVKMTRDKLELTEKLSAEKYLNRELTIKLAEIDEKAKDMHIKLMAKDEEMIRLQTSYRDMEKNFEKLTENTEQTPEGAIDKNIDHESHIIEPEKTSFSHSETNIDEHNRHHHTEESEHKCLLETTDEEHNSNIRKEDAMIKLQDRFLKIMEEVADLSDEKHRLAHIILQLQTETDTICEYVALYQQQRSLLKKRDEERSAQIKIFQSECDRLKRELEELSGILRRFAEDKQLSAYFEIESKQNDLAKVMDLLSNLKNNSLIDPKRKSVDFKNFYPCSCCSGKLIEV